MTLPFSAPASLPPQFTLSRCTPDDIPQLTEVYINAFSATNFDYWWPPVDIMRQWTLQRFALKIQNPTNQHFKVVDNETGQVVAFSRWDIPAGMKGLDEGFIQYGSEEESKKVLPIPVGCDMDMYKEFFNGLKGMSKKWDADSKLGKSSNTLLSQPIPSKILSTRCSF